VKVVHSRPGTLQLTKSRLRSIGKLGYTILFFTVWYWLLLGSGEVARADAPFLFKLLFWLVPLFALPDVVRDAKVMLAGESFTLNRDTGKIERNGALLAYFSDVARIQVRTIRNDEGADDHRVSIVLKSDDKCRIEQSSNAAEITNIAEDLADILGVEVTRKT
jgi:hypothetical protein